MSNHPAYSTPDPALLPPEVRDIAAAADAAGQRAHDLKVKAQTAARKVADAEREWPARLAAAAADPEGSSPADRRPALAVEAARADELARAADVHARGQWQQLRQALSALDADALAHLEPAIESAADEYRARLDDLLAARDALHEALRVRQWLSAAIVGSRGANGGVRQRLGAYRPQRGAPDLLPRAGRFHDLSVADVVASIHADADQLGTLKASEQRHAALLAEDAAARAANAAWSERSA